MALFRNLPEAGKSQCQSAKGGQVCGIACATYTRYASALSLDFFDLAEKCLIYDLETHGALFSFLDGY
jgi:hypothetical protein